jgi:hypothetical protein
MRRVRVIIVAAEKQYYILAAFVCILCFPGRNEHATYCHPWPVRLYDILHIISQTARFFRKRVLNFSTILPATFLIIRRNEQEVIINVYWISCNERNC